MALLTKKEFAGLCGQSTKWLASYLGRGKAVAGESGMLDTDNPLNKAFLEKHGKVVATVENKPKPERVNLPPMPVGAVPDYPDEDYTGDDAGALSLFDGKIPALHVSERKLKHLDTVKRAKEIARLELDIEKKRGEVVPVDPIEVLVFKYKQTILTQMKLCYEAFLNEISHKYTIAGDDMAQYRNYFITHLNSSVVAADDNFLKELDVTLNEFSVKKGIGEREQ
jgi:hypothetical protein